MVPYRERYLTGTPLQPSDLRLRELMQGHAKGYHSMVPSDPEMYWLFFTGLVLGVLFLAVAIWSHRGGKALRARKLRNVRSHAKRRPKRRKRMKR